MIEVPDVLVGVPSKMNVVPSLALRIAPGMVFLSSLVFGTLPGVVVAALDGPFLGGLGALIGSVTSLVLGVMTFMEKRRESSARAWEARARALLDELEARRDEP